jgi:hypothetical protein
MEHEFTSVINDILLQKFGNKGHDIFTASPLLQYLNHKTKSASRGSKSRGAFAVHYALYVLIEDYLKKDFFKSGNYQDYEGAVFSDLFERQRKLPFGQKLQNHTLNNRLNFEFKRFFPLCDYLPIIHDAVKRRYWINENLLLVQIGKQTVNISECIIQIIKKYIGAKTDSFKRFITDCENLWKIDKHRLGKVREFISSLIKPNVDARIFEIVSYAVLKAYYGEKSIFWGFTTETIHKDCLVLYKTGRTNANDGGIDFVMKPLGRFFQVTETINVTKYFLDIDKVQRYPMTFVVKSEETTETIENRIREQAKRTYRINKIVDTYMTCIEEIINIPVLLERFVSVVSNGKLEFVIDEIVKQSKVEFNYLDITEKQIQ